ncbi:phenylalanine--tRNA ligase subunit alpha [Candidatus Campbellbacteria bacterium CG11_big_fil_rev_8_21_14_0_20_44_21]|uniref:phenylalanine--tRNA ligase n=1 Tax=Candidatus Campbellbacteria bacterium CG22_combo_CG10-13_8_21_14_all_43_18 TaxID=1974530 RepID=A0A2H0DWT3_9BACT|nr:MAG: phenylalanine--tRNA ligase subunit alpha [Candidatus Campbellbacteria bacterium CG22_combo_CG10-13_8_21_14_all_43_18]PIR24525.1 MAG: phenylalanine--tRNA ligase subunit alpha [Candidatus Campbellbacteria bacterium CG11_big_fil_rev_8_21_14_0_20_44_21]
MEEKRGHYHPLSIVGRDIIRIWSALGFEIATGPEIETEHYNFDALNIPDNHPARDLWDTFWLKSKIKNQKTKIGENLLLRTHTSPMQVRYMENNKPPFAIIVPGKTFRYEATDATHEAQFHQLEGLMVGENINLSNFKAIILKFFEEFFGEKKEIRLRPSYFPFVEPGVEVDLRNPGEKKWLEIMGAGMVHPKVLEDLGINHNKFQGFAFGMGLDRLAMIKYGIPDIRLFYSGDLRLVDQF